MDELPAGWIVDLEFFRADPLSFVKAHDGWFSSSDERLAWVSIAVFINIIQGNNPPNEEAMSVAFRQPEINDIAERHNNVLQKCRDAVNGEAVLDGRFIKYRNFFLDTGNNLAPVGLLAVANNIFLKEYRDDHDFIEQFTKGDEK